MEVGERIVAFDKGKGEEEMTSEEDALQLLSRKRNKEGERQSIQSTKRRKTKPGKPTRRVACKRERTTTESATTEMKGSKRMRKTAQKPEVASVKTTKIHNNKLWQSWGLRLTNRANCETTGLTGESNVREAETTGDAYSEMTRIDEGAGLSTKVSVLENEKKPTICTIIQFFDKLSNGGSPNSNVQKNSELKLKTQFGKISQKSSTKLD